MKYNPNLREKLRSNTKQETNRQATKEDKTSAKETAEAFSAITGQEISEEEVSLIQDIQLPEDEVKEMPHRYNPDVYFVECVCCDFEHVFNIILGKKTGTTFPISDTISFTV